MPDARLPQPGSSCHASRSQAIKLAPRVAELYANRAAAYIEDGQLEDAIMDCHHALDIDPALTYAHYSMGSVAFCPLLAWLAPQRQQQAPLLV